MVDDLRINRLTKAVRLLLQNYKHEITYQNEDYLATLNTNYTSFLIDDINFESFPPLQSNLGAISFSIPYETIIFKKLD
mgnify:CR=1 FL=1